MRISEPLRKRACLCGSSLPIQFDTIPPQRDKFARQVASRSILTARPTALAHEDAPMPKISHTLLAAGLLSLGVGAMAQPSAPAPRRPQGRTAHEGA